MDDEIHSEVERISKFRRIVIIAEWTVSTIAALTASIGIGFTRHVSWRVTSTLAPCCDLQYVQYRCKYNN